MITGVLFVDLDDFQVVNDIEGTQRRRRVADRNGLYRLAAAGPRSPDTAARLGGDEFAVLIGNAESFAAVEATADRIVNAFREPFTLGTGLATVTVTVGVATTVDSTDTDELLRHADLALYAAKSAGKRQWRLYQPVLSVGDLLRRREHPGTHSKRRSPHPPSRSPTSRSQLDTGTCWSGFEAPIRWPHPRGGA